MCGHISMTFIRSFNLSLTFFRMQYTNHKPPYHGEPLNIIITALSDPYILTDEGLQAYSKSVSSFSD